VCTVCPSFLSFFLDNRLRELLFRPDRILAPFIREGMTVADVGCGPGFFTVPMARLAGPSGRVFAVDLQRAMLEKVRAKALKEMVDDRIVLRECGPDSLGLQEPLDFALCFWMLHEVPSQEHLLSELAGLLKPGATLLLAEPWAHVSRRRFDRTLACASRAGFTAAAAPRIRGSYAACLSAPGIAGPSVLVGQPPA
jgi:ubiquinone/menaquinone biosynthesis C-methylase UbiE